MTKRMGRPPRPDERKQQVWSWLPPDLAAWFMALPSKDRSAWLAEKVAESRDKRSDKGAHPDNPAS